MSLLLAGGAFGVFYWLRLSQDASLEEAQTAATTVFVIGETWAAIVVFGLAVYGIIEIEKRVVGHRLQGATFRRVPGPEAGGR